MVACTASSRATSGGQPQGKRRKSVSFDAVPEFYPVQASPADAVEELWQADALSGEQESDSDVSMGSHGGPGGAAPPVPSDAHVLSLAQQDDDGVSLAEIEAYADEQAIRFIPLTDRRRASRTVTVSIGRSRQVDSISFQVQASTLWQRRSMAGGGQS